MTTDGGPWPSADDANAAIYEIGLLRSVEHIAALRKEFIVDETPIHEVSVPRKGRRTDDVPFELRFRDL